MRFFPPHFSELWWGKGKYRKVLSAVRLSASVLNSGREQWLSEQRQGCCFDDSLQEIKDWRRRRGQITLNIISALALRFIYFARYIYFLPRVLFCAAGWADASEDTSLTTGLSANQRLIRQFKGPFVSVRGWHSHRLPCNLFLCMLFVSGVKLEFADQSSLSLSCD